MKNAPLILGILGIGGFFAYKAFAGGGAPGASDLATTTRNNSWGLPDVDSANQEGGYDTTYDESYEKASGATGVPFALIKAHAIRESNQVPTAYHSDTATQFSYGLMQVEWSMDSSSSLYNRLSKYGSQYSGDQLTPSVLEDPDTSALLGASIIADNLNWLTPSGKNGLQGLRDTINAYNTGTPESKIPAPNNYVNDVLKYYAAIIGQNVTC
jgi:soluble lytic murein transglycosylase-like protein